MISKLHRFHGYGSLKYVYQHGRTVRGPLLAIKYVANPRRKMYRAAVVVSKKVHKSAVKRNRIRRRLYEIIRLQEDRMTQPYDITVTVFHEKIAELPAPQLERAVVKLLEQAGIVSGHAQGVEDE